MEGRTDLRIHVPRASDLGDPLAFEALLHGPLSLEFPRNPRDERRHDRLVHPKAAAEPSFRRVGGGGVANAEGPGPARLTHAPEGSAQSSEGHREDQCSVRRGAVARRIVARFSAATDGSDGAVQTVAS